MNTFKAFAMGEATRYDEPMVFDWDKAAHYIRALHPQRAAAGLRDDWEWTGGFIYENGEPMFEGDGLENLKYYTYLQSTWAVPELDLDGEIIECYVMKHEHPEWNAYTQWPQSARDILLGKCPSCPFRTAADFNERSTQWNKL